MDKRKHTFPSLCFHYFSLELLTRTVSIPLEGGAGSVTEFPANVLVPPTTTA